MKVTPAMLREISGTIQAVNDALMAEPQLVNDGPYEQGWLIKVTPDDPSDITTLMTAEQYANQVAGS